GGSPPYNIAWDTVNTTNIFVVTVGTETAANPNPPSIGIDFYIDGTETKELTLTRGFEYLFSVSGGHPFHISTQLPGATTVGIVTNGQTGAPTGSGTVSFKPDNTHPTLLYYPCGSHQYMGYKINVTNGYVTQNPINLHAGTYMVRVID